MLRNTHTRTFLALPFFKNFFRNKEKVRPIKDFEEEWVDLGKQFFLNVFEPGYIYLTLNDGVKFTKINVQTFLIGDMQCYTFLKKIPNNIFVNIYKKARNFTLHLLIFL